MEQVSLVILVFFALTHVLMTIEMMMIIPYRTRVETWRRLLLHSVYGSTASHVSGSVPDKVTIVYLTE